MKIQELKKLFHDGTLTKPQFQKMMFQKHKVLYEYAEEIKNTDLFRIAISDNGVEFTSREHGIKFISKTCDRGIAPIGMFNMGSYEKNEIDMCLSFVESNFTIFDVGANVGWFTLVMLKNKPNLSMYSFEPIPETFKILNNNISINFERPVNTYNFGFYSENTSRTFYHYKECSGKSSAAHLDDDEVSEVICTLKKMDTFVKDENITSLDFIKCDVEGAEYFVYQGAIETLKKFKPIIFSEMLRKWSAKFDYHPNQIIGLLKDLGYGCFTLYNGNLKEFFKMNELTVETNFFFLHKEKHADHLQKK